MRCLDRALVRWRYRLAHRRPVRDVELTIEGTGARYLIALPAEPDRVLDELPAHGSLAGDDDLRMPYWATPWASGLALAAEVLRRATGLAGRRVAELGCGLGITATAAVDAGAQVLAIDCFGEALAYCRYNVARNTGRVPHTRLADWRVPAGRATLAAQGPFDLVLAADVLYEGEDIEPLLSLVPQLLRDGGECWLAEPGRVTSQRFIAAAHRAGWHASSWAASAAWPAGGVSPAQVVIHRYRFAAAGVDASRSPAPAGPDRHSRAPSPHRASGSARRCAPTARRRP